MTIEQLIKKKLISTGGFDRSRIKLILISPADYAHLTKDTKSYDISYSGLTNFKDKNYISVFKIFGHSVSPNSSLEKDSVVFIYKDDDDDDDFEPKPKPIIKDLREQKKQKVRITEQPRRIRL